jgi:hypothetical protein
LALALLLGFRSSAGASPTIDVRVSVKVIRNPANGTRPPVPGTTLTDGLVTHMLDIANQRFLEPYWRGYRYVLAGPVIEVGQPCNPCGISNPSFWYATGFGDSMDVFENQAMIDPDYAWDFQAMNVYINAGQGNGGVSSFPSPPDAEHLTVLGSAVFDTGFNDSFPAATFVHESGHYFGLGHTNAEACSVCVVYPGCTLVPGDGDQIADTIDDHPCSSRDELAAYNFPGEYPNLTPEHWMDVDNVFWNNMAYLHPGQAYGATILERRTEGQLDFWTDTADLARLTVVSGRTWFVALNGSNGGPGYSTTPFRLPSQGQNAADAGGGDIVLLLPGTYLENPTFTKPMTLRATRQGVARIGN